MPRAAARAAGLAMKKRWALRRLHEVPPRHCSVPFLFYFPTLRRLACTPGDVSCHVPVSCRSTGRQRAHACDCVALHWVWCAQGKEATRPNLVMGAETHVCW